MLWRTCGAALVALASWACSAPSTAEASPEAAPARDAREGESPEPEPENGDEDELTPEAEGARLYARNCAGCHGERGAGDGETARALGVTARDFAAGGFSFGNAHEDLVRTIRSGIPGRSVMPAFGGILAQEEIELLARHVATLMPPPPVEDRAASVMRADGRAVSARGKLPPLEEGARALPRGLLLGLPSGLTFEYDLDPVRLVAVRLGPFADREDWRDRGGGYLRPLGRVVHALGAREAALAFEKTRASEPSPLTGRLESTWTRGERAGLDYLLVRTPVLGGAPVARVRESLRAVPLSAGGAFARRLELEALEGPLTVELVLPGGRATRFDAALVPEPFRARWSVGARAADEEGVAPLSECVRFSQPTGAVRTAIGEILLLRLALEPGTPAVIEAIVTLLPDASAERLATLEQEIEALARREGSR